MPSGKTAASRWFAPKVATASILLSSDDPFARVLLLVACLVPVMLFEALVLRSMWQWFVTPLWPRPITYAEALGLTLLSFLVRANRWSLPDKERGDLWTQILQVFAHIFGRALLWGLAAACHALLF